MKLDGKKILITGASGFVGSVILRRLVTQYPKSKPFIILRKEAKLWRIKDIISKVKVVNVDLQDAEKLKTEVEKIKPDAIFHLAAFGAYPQQNDLHQAVATNVVGVTNLLQAAEKVNYQVFVNSGSSSEYGYKNKPMKESDLTEPASYYAATKVSATHIVNTYGQLNNRPTLTLRLFSIYGPYEESGRFVPTAILNAISDRDINVVKGPKRDFVYVEDVVDAYLKCLNLKNFNHRIFNLSSGRQTSIEQDARLIAKLAKSKSKINLGAYKPRPWDTSYWVGSNALAKKDLHWYPKHSLTTGLKKSIIWFKQHKDFYEKP